MDAGHVGRRRRPGTIYKLDAQSGYQPRPFANVTLNGRPNSGAALGNIAYDRWNRQLFVSDLETGMIHRIRPPTAPTSASTITACRAAPTSWTPKASSSAACRRFRSIPARRRGSTIVRPANSSIRRNAGTSRRTAGGCGGSASGGSRPAAKSACTIRSRAARPGRGGGLEQPAGRREAQLGVVDPDRPRRRLRHLERAARIHDAGLLLQSAGRHAGGAEPAGQRHLVPGLHRPSDDAARRARRHSQSRARQRISVRHAARVARAALRAASGRRMAPGRPLRRGLLHPVRRRRALPVRELRRRHHLWLRLHAVWTVDPRQPDQFVWITGDALCSPKGLCKAPAAAPGRRRGRSLGSARHPGTEGEHLRRAGADRGLRRDQAISGYPPAPSASINPISSTPTSMSSRRARSSKRSSRATTPPRSAISRSSRSARWRSPPASSR